MTPTEALAQVLAEYGDSPAALAAAIGGTVKRQHIEYWVSAGHVPERHAPAVERAVEGRFSCEQLSREGVQWARIADRQWPWHKRGRPVLDVTKAVA